MSTKVTKGIPISFNDMVDEQIIESAKAGDVEAWDFLMSKYKNFVRSKAKSYFLIGADREDIVQEGMFGLYKAIRDFNASRLSSFRAFAELCIRRQIITAVKTSLRQKHSLLNSSISLNKPLASTSNRTLLETIGEETVNDPEELMIVKEELNNMRIKMQNSLSDFEWKVLVLYLDGMSYHVMSKKLKKSVKSIDNALQRAKKKINEDSYVNENNDEEFFY